ncbi:MAG: efflux RND transporter permease subunit [Solirubrobacterales bacterium]
MSSVLGRVAGWAVSRPLPVVAAAIFIAVFGVVLAAARLSPDTGTGTLLDSGSETFEATERFKDRFGDDAVVILVEGDLEDLVLGEDLGTLLGLEGCLSGRGEPVEGPAVDAQAIGVCRQLALLDPVRVVYGPATFLNQAAVQANAFIDEQTRFALDEARAAGDLAADRAAADGASEEEQQRAGDAAAGEVLAQFGEDVVALAAEFGQTGLPRLDNAGFVSSIVFDPSQGGQPKARFAYLFPSSEAALISVRLKPELSDEDRREAIGLIRAAVEDERFGLAGGTYVVSGVPVVLEGLADELVSETLIALLLALVVMGLVLLVIFRPPLRLLPLAIALVASGATFGLLALVGGSLTMASVAVLPVLIGLAVDYAVQLHSRYAEALSAGLSPARAAVDAAARGGPVIGTAVVASAAGFAVLFFSPIPMVRAFGLMLVAGIAFAFVVALTAGLGALVLASQPRAVRSRGDDDLGTRLTPAVHWVRRRGAALAQGLHGPTSAARGGVAAIGNSVLAVSIRAPLRVLAAALLLAALGWGLGTRTEVVSDIRELVPGDLPALESVDRLQTATGVSGEVDVLVGAPDVTDPEVIGWMREFRSRVLARNGFEGDFPDCRAPQTELCPAIALPDLFSAEGPPTRQEVDTILRVVPEYFSQAVLASADDGSDTVASIAFGIREMPLDEQKLLIDDIRAQIDPAGGPSPPAGVEAEVVGLPVLAGDANEELSGSRYWLALFGLIAVALVLVAVYRSARRALVPLVPIVLATGWSALVLAALGIPLNPMSATLGALVIAISTEFSVILSARFHEERARGKTIGDAIRTTYARTGVAVAASGVTTIAGFAVLITSGISMLSEFGIVTVIDLGVALLGVMIVLPAALVLAEGGLPTLSRRRLRSGTAQRSEREAAS